VKKLLAGITSIVIALGLIATTAVPAQAHTPTVTSTCGALTVDLKYYAPSSTNTNTVTVWIDNVVQVDTTFQATYNAVYNFANSTTVHTWRVKVFAFDNSAFSFDTSGSSTPCVLATAPTLSPPACTGPGTSSTGTYAIPVTAGVTYQVKLGSGDFADASAGNYDVTVGTIVRIRAFALDGYTLSGTSQWGPVTYSGVGDCRVPTVPAAPAFAPASCTGPGTYGTGSYTIPTTVGITYQTKFSVGGGYADSAAGTFPVNVGTIVYVKAVAVAGYSLAGTSTWGAFSFDSPGACLVTAIPTEPAFVDATCTGPGTYSQGSFSIPSVAGVQYQLSVNGGAYGDIAPGTYPVAVGATVAVRAVPLAGYTLSGLTEWSHSYGSPGACLEQAFPTAPAYAPGICSGPGTFFPGSYTIPTVPGVQYQVDLDGTGYNDVSGGVHPVGVGTVVTIRAVAQTGYTLSGATAWPPVTIASSGDCLVDVTTTAPSFAPAVCTAPGSHSQGKFTIPAVPGVQYRVDIDGAGFNDIGAGSYPVALGTVVTITAVPLFGYTLLGATSWDPYSFASPGECLVEVVTADPTFADSVCRAAGDPTEATYTIVGADHITYWVSIDGHTEVLTPGGTYVIASGSTVDIRAVADPGYVIDQSDAGPWAHSYAPADDCIVEVTPTPPSAADESCDEQFGELIAGFVTIPSTEHVAYFIDGDPVSAGDHDRTPGDYVVTAQPENGYALSGYPADGWTLTIATEEQCGDLDTDPLVVPLASMAQLGCGTDGSFTLSNDLLIPDAIFWTVDGAPSPEGTFTVTRPGTVVISAAPVAPTYGFAVDTLSQWSLVFSRPLACDLDTLAFTGRNVAPPVIVVAALLLVLGGALLTADQRVRVRRAV
jgi:hypothetical protein